MKKIISLFKRNYDGDRNVINEVVPGAEWVIAGEGVATHKMDGTCCMVQDNKLFKRYDAKSGKTPPEGFIPSQEPDSITGHWPGWVPVGNGPEDKWHREAWKHQLDHAGVTANGTYELIGPKINGNPEECSTHLLVPHGSEQVFPPMPIQFDTLRDWLRDQPIEGIVWHHPDGRMVKIKTRDFGIPRRAVHPKPEPAKE